MENYRLNFGRVICDAMEAGYRYFDTASIYDTERDLGRAIFQYAPPETFESESIV